MKSFRRAITALIMPTLVDAQKERKARYISLFLVLFVILCGIGFVTEVIAPLPGEMLSTCLFGVGFVVTGVLNRLGFVFGAGILCIGLVVAGIAFSFVFYPLDLTSLPVLSFLIISIIIAGLILPRYMIFVVAVLDSALVVGLLYFLPLEPSLQQFLHDNALLLFEKPLLLYMEAAFSTYIVVFFLEREIQRANRAEEVARLQKQIASDRQMLADSVEQISQVLLLVSSGQMDARVSMEEGHVLWSVAVPLNNVLDQLQRKESPRLSTD